MPDYTFMCESCGTFDLRRASSDAGAPATCPECGRDARRIYLPPGVARTSPAARALLTAEERSAHEPVLTREKRGRPVPHRHAAAPPWIVGH